MARSPRLPQRIGDTTVWGLEGSRLRDARKAAGFTQASLAAAIEIHPQLVSDFERGVKQPGSDTVMRLIATLGVQAADICVTTPAGAA